MGNETFASITTNITNNVLISMGIVISSLFFFKVKSLFKQSVLEPEVISSPSLYVPRGTNSLNFICENYQTVDFALFRPYYLTGSLRPHAYLNYNGTVSVQQPTFTGNTTLLFENVKEFMEIYSVKINGFIQLVDVFTIYGKIPFCVMFFLSVYKHCIPYNFVSLCGKFLLKTLLSLKKVS